MQPIASETGLRGDKIIKVQHVNGDVGRSSVLLAINITSLQGDNPMLVVVPQIRARDNTFALWTTPERKRFHGEGRQLVRIDHCPETFEIALQFHGDIHNCDIDIDAERV